ncbi:MAG: NAD-dependent malic enzyme [Phycisphaerales bacterium]|jgi:malic enzyme
MTPLRGQALLNHPLCNKDTAFTQTEREAFHLEGLLPAEVNTIEQQAARAYESITRKSDPLERYIGLVALQDRNEHVFYRLLLDHVEEFLPIVYTPTVGLACQAFSHIYRRPRGVWITPDHRGRIEQVLGNAPFQDVRLIVVTDNERILGLGDLGAGGMGIPIGKLALYTLAAGIDPSQSLPVSLDVGTDNEQLLADCLYVGWRHRRLRGEEYFSLVEEFVSAVRRRFPRAILQWEDFKHVNAVTLLDRYRSRLPSFNDDIQGTASVVLAALLAAERLTSVSMREQRVVILGAGGAGVGIARQLRRAMSEAGVEGDRLRTSIAVLDSRGFIHDGRDLPEPSKREVAWPREMAAACGIRTDGSAGLEHVVRTVRPTVLIGVSGQAGAFTRQIVAAMAAAVDRPVILPLSNPTSQTEATPADLLAWTDGRAIVATGGPFEPVSVRGKTVRVGQANNVYIFPGIGLGALVAEAPEITDAMFTAAAQALAEQVTDADLSTGSLFPPLSNLRQITAQVAAAVVRTAFKQDVSRAGGRTDDPVATSISLAMWRPEYPVIEAATDPAPSRACSEGCRSCGEGGKAHA